MIRAKIPFDGSFQKGNLYRTGNGFHASWKHLQRIGTKENLSRVASANHVDISVVDKASLRIRQAIEFREAAVYSSVLTKPLLLYYSALNLVRGILFALSGDIGGSSHGLKYSSGSSLVDCTATVKKSGTFPKILELQKVTEWDSYSCKDFSLIDFLLLIPELQQEMHLLTDKNSLISIVKVEAFINDDSILTFFNTKLTKEDFEINWKDLFPWFSEECDYHGEYSLKVKQRFRNHEEVIAFCHKKLIRDLYWRDNAFWFDHINRKYSLLLPRLPAYLGGLYILSNISRYEPEYLKSALQPTDLAYAINAFLDNAERCIPLLIIEMLEGPTYYV